MKFSVLMSVYKNENPEWFRTAVKSVAEQTVKPDEILIVQDGMLSDELYSVCDELKQCYPVIRYLKLDKNSGLGELFDFVFISEDVGAEKPAKEFFDKVLVEVEAKIGKFQLDEVLLVGDSLTSDIKGANNAGVKSCWYNPEGVACDKDVQIDYEIKDLHEMYEILK